MAQRTWLRSFLESSGDTPAIVVLHHTLGEQDSDLADTDRFLRIVRPVRKVKAILCGHGHEYSYQTDGDLHIVNMPALGYAHQQPVGWLDTVFRKDGAEFTLRAIGGDTSQNGKTHQLRWRS
jgi:hypothetical protein